MQNKYFRIYTILFLSAIAGYGHAQTTTGNPGNNGDGIITLVKAEGETTATVTGNSEMAAKPESGITVLSTESGQKTLLIHDLALRNEIFNNREKRDMLTALPGFISLGTLENGLRVTITNEYINQYLVKYLGVKEAYLSNLK